MVLRSLLREHSAGRTWLERAVARRQEASRAAAVQSDLLIFDHGRKDNYIRNGLAENHGSYPAVEIISNDRPNSRE